MKIANVTFNAKTVRIFIIFACACLTMTGHFIASATTGHTSDITIITSDGSNGGKGGDGGDAQSLAAVAADSAKTENAAAVGAEADSGAAVESGNASGANGTEGAGYGAENIGGDASNSGAVIDEFDGAGGAPAVRNGYSIPGGGANNPIPDQEKIYVYVTGAVQKPGVYELARSSMVIDAVELAGGFTEQADAENINMVYRLESNAMLNIKKKLPYAAGGAGGTGGESGEGGTGAGINGNAGGDANASGEASGAVGQNSSELYGSAAEIAYNYDGVLMTGDNAAEDAESPGARRVNINTAPAEELATLPGIGKSTADSIIAYRGKQKFNRIEDLMKVSGIKQAKFDAVKDLISC